MVKNLPANAGDMGRGVDLLEQEMAFCSRILAWKIPWIEEPSGSIGSQIVGHN